MKSEWERKGCRHANNGSILGEEEDQREDPKKVNKSNARRHMEILSLPNGPMIAQDS